jgi:hypothetical protein
MRTRSLFIPALALTTVIALAPPALAHHSFAAEYDADKPVTLTGSVTKMAWINPHSWIYIDVKKADGTVENWAIEAGPPGTLVRARASGGALLESGRATLAFGRVFQGSRWRRRPAL